MKIRTEFPHPVTETPDMGITLPDGCRLSARVWMPETATPVPAILEFLPYGFSYVALEDLEKEAGAQVRAG